MLEQWLHRAKKPPAGSRVVGSGSIKSERVVPGGSVHTITSIFNDYDFV